MNQILLSCVDNMVFNACHTNCLFYLALSSLNLKCLRLFHLNVCMIAVLGIHAPRDSSMLWFSCIRHPFVELMIMDPLGFLVPKLYIS